MPASNWVRHDHELHRQAVEAQDTKMSVEKEGKGNCQQSQLANSKGPGQAATRRKEQRCIHGGLRYVVRAKIRRVSS